VEPLTRGLPPPDPHSLCPLSSTEFLNPPQKKILGTPLVCGCIYDCMQIFTLGYSPVKSLKTYNVHTKRGLPLLSALTNHCHSCTKQVLLYCNRLGSNTTRNICVKSFTRYHKASTNLNYTRHALYFTNKKLYKGMMPAETNPKHSQFTAR
jgi:hypothetical protein